MILVKCDTFPNLQFLIFSISAAFIFLPASIVPCLSQNSSFSSKTLHFLPQFPVSSTIPIPAHNSLFSHNSWSLLQFSVFSYNFLVSFTILCSLTILHFHNSLLSPTIPTSFHNSLSFPQFQLLSQFSFSYSWLFLSQFPILSTIT